MACFNIIIENYAFDLLSGAIIRHIGMEDDSLGDSSVTVARRSRARDRGEALVVGGQSSGEILAANVLGVEVRKLCARSASGIATNVTSHMAVLAVALEENITDYEN